MFDVGLTTFMILATSLVMLMTPGLAFFYGGLGSKKHILSIMMQSFVSLGLTSVLWFFFGYSLCFSGNMKDGTDFFGLIGNLDKAFLHGITPKTVFSPDHNFPEYIFIAYQMMFAIITPALITGAFINRISFKAYFWFLVLWQLFVYYKANPQAFSRENLGRGIFSLGVLTLLLIGFVALLVVFLSN